MNLKNWCVSAAMFILLVGTVGCNDDPGNSNNGNEPADAGDVSGGDVSDVADTGDAGAEDGAMDAESDADDAADTTGDASDASDADEADTGDDADGGLTCTAPEEACGDACIDTTSSVDHCGGCNDPCPTPQNTVVTCASSTCEFACESGWIDTDADTSNGCECTQTNGGTEICDGVDNDCDGDVDEGCDEDGDGYCAETATVESGATCQAGDCDDTDATINPGAAPACDGVDNNCDGSIDNLLPVPAAQQTMILSGSDSASRDYPSPVLSTFTGNGFCVAALDDAAGTLELGYLQTNGQTERIQTSLPGGVNVDILDLEWDGTACAVLYREGPSSLNLQRWVPASGSSVTLEVANDLSGDDSWEGVRNAALWFGSVRRCTAGTCTPSPRWVVAYVEDLENVSDDVVFNTVPKVFAATETLLSPVVLDTSAPVNGDVDVVGPSTSGNGFLVLDKTSRNLTTVREVFEEQQTLRDDLDVNNSDVTRAMMNEVNGTHFMQYRRAATSSVRQTRLSVMTDTGFGTGGYAVSSFDDDYLGRDFVWPIDGVDHFYIDGYSDKVYTTSETGSSSTFYQFTELTHPNFGTFNELLAPGREAGSFWVARLVGDAPYEIALDAYGCF